MKEAADAVSFFRARVRHVAAFMNQPSRWHVTHATRSKLVPDWPLSVTESHRRSTVDANQRRPAIQATTWTAPVQGV